jgi:hypothetical protein
VPKRSDLRPALKSITCINYMYTYLYICMYICTYALLKYSFSLFTQVCL